ncbi:SPOR domain-containing protein [Psychrosphaera sp. B3R10]|uniref:SPOR domain-containing protein n=1 Tax=unclassified Psychrosphaera TaxID=2641570 RepID=UPI001C0A2CA3|nr:SPOR domain-containing protein [Psychrosphaera sp. 1_MG-2023]MBU2880914.1 SPOR domain-containing protein [Psychrosphaera sp. I2R16]MBU2990867.1 SPOR domain-containing protein [Psychrosphaera sp. B3R10]MDO6720563.1 SPOR domain-containing protein [Psychrosphaera sp. 1_MG-2023]
MSEIIKQRLVGMLIIVIAGVVFLPDLLDGEKQLTKEEFKKVPAKPEINEQPILTEFPAQQISDAMLNAPVNNTKPSDSDNESEKQSVNQDGSVNVAAADIIEKGDSTQVSTLKEETSNFQSASTPTPVSNQVKFKEPAWILQLGSFKHKENVNVLRQKLADAGLKTFTKPVQTKGGVLSKVYLGPELNKDVLILAQAKIKEIADVEGKITRYDPIK